MKVLYFYAKWWMLFNGICLGYFFTLTLVFASISMFFENEDTAIAAGYRPCAKCMPDEYTK